MNTPANSQEYVVKMTKAQKKETYSKGIVSIKLNTYLVKLMDHKKYIAQMRANTLHKLLDFILIRMGVVLTHSETKGLQLSTVPMDETQYDMLVKVVDSIREVQERESITTEEVSVKSDDAPVPSESSINKKIRK